MDGRAAGTDLPAWRVLPALALAALADARCASIDPVAPGPASPDPVAAARLARGVADLTAALRPGADASTAPVDAHRALVATAELTAHLAEAARHVAWTAGFCGQEQAAEVADAIMTTAWALRVLAELGLRVVPAPDAGGPAPDRDPAP